MQPWSGHPIMSPSFECESQGGGENVQLSASYKPSHAKHCKRLQTGWPSVWYRAMRAVRVVLLWGKRGQAWANA